MFEPIPIEEFRDRSQIRKKEFTTNWGAATQVVSLRQVSHVHSVSIMPREYLMRLLRNITLSKDTSVHPYKTCRINTSQIDPHSLKIGQTFVQRDKYQNFVEGFLNIFSGFCISRGMQKSPLIVLGQTADGAYAIAHYLPSIIEMNSHLALLDGIHRNYVVKSVGSTLEAIIIEGVEAPFPASLHDWEEIRVVSRKPPKEERYFDLKSDLFRNLEYVGIDG